MEDAKGPEKKRSSRLPRNSRIKKLARELYFKFRPIDEIMEQTGANKGSLITWIYGRRKNDPEGWRSLRDQELGKFIEDVTIRNTNTAHRSVRLGFQMIHESLNYYYNRTDAKGNPIPLTLKDAKYVAQIVTSIQKLMSFGNRGDDEENDLPAPVNPDYLRTKPATLEELRAAVMKDPFLGQLIEGETNGDEREVRESPEGITDAELAEPGIQAEVGGPGLYQSTVSDGHGEGARIPSPSSDSENGDAGEDDSEFTE